MKAEAEYQPWFERYPKLFHRQKEILEAVGFHFESDAATQLGIIKFKGLSKADPARQLIIIFPNAFPSRAPLIFDTNASKLLSRHHRGDTRQLCLFGFNEDRWNAELSVAEAFKEAEELIVKFKDEIPADANDPPEPIARAIRYSQAAILVPPPISTFKDFEQLKLPSGKFSAKFDSMAQFKRETKGRGIVLQATFGDTTLSCSQPYSGYFTKGQEVHGDWFYLKEPPTQANLLDVLNKCFEKCKAIKRTDYYWFALVFREENGTRDKFRFTWLITRAERDSKNSFHIIRTFPYIQEERYVRIPGLEGLEEKRVMIIGCGSLGSKIAANLAASGINRFYLVDCDYYEPNNSVRHEVGVESFGFDKECALLMRLVSLNPTVASNSSTFNFQVGGLTNTVTEKQFFDLVRNSDVIINATGVHSVSHYLNELSLEFGVPILFTTITNGAWSGEVVRVVPGQTPCWMCWVDEYGDQHPASDPQYADVFAPGCDQPTFTGTTYDLGIVASLASSMVVETLLKKDTDFAKNYIRWSHKDPAGKPIFLTEFLPTHRQKKCWWCDR